MATSEPSRKKAFLSAVPDYKTNWKGQVDYAVFKDPETKAYLSRQFSTPEESAERWLVQWERPLESLRPSRRTKYKKFIASFKPSGGQTSPQQAPATTQSPTPAPAQISPTGTPQNPQMSQSLAPERTGPTVIVSQNPSSPAQQMMSSGGGGSSGGGSSQISDFALLNNFIKNKLLLDLAYL